MADQPYTEADVAKLAEAMYEDDEGSTPGAWYKPWAEVEKSTWKTYTWRAKVALGHLAATGRLLPGSARFPLSCDCPTRCSSRMSDGIVVLQCQRPVHADDKHRTIHENWLSGDDRELGSTDE